MKNFSHQFPFSLRKISSKESLVLYISMFVMGACGLAYEYTLSKVASDILGNSIRQWAIIIGVMMFFMGVGSDLQKYFNNRDLVDKFIYFEILIGLLGAFGPITLLYTFAKIPSHYVLVQYFFVTAIGLIIGFEIPLITRINETFISELRLNLGAVLKMDYIGALVGSLVWIFLLPKYFTIMQSAFVLGLANISIALMTFIFFKGLVRQKQKIAASIFVVFILIGVGFFSAKGWTTYSEQFLYRDRILLSETTKYQHIVLTQSRAGDISCYINGHLQFNSFDEAIYHENLVHPAFALSPVHKRVLILGGGDGLALREVLKYKDVQSVTLCDIDPQMTTLAAKNPYFQKLNKNSLQNSRLTIIHNNALIPAGKEMLQIENQNDFQRYSFHDDVEINVINIDAAKFVEQISGVYDIIIIDFPDPNSFDLSKLYSVNFYRHVKKKLSAYGIVVQQSTSPIHAKEVFLCIGRTIKSAGLAVVPYHDNVPTFGEWGWWIGGRAERYSPETIAQKLRTIDTLDVPTKYLTPELIHASLIFGKNQLKSLNSDVNTIDNNRAFAYYLKAWQRE
ncbi:MAG: polyamine aminopropyltransferase [Calditrichaeota bacterium]|nr:polyamine aminopropyltransferase [Calditrichota bacterium]